MAKRSKHATALFEVMARSRGSAGDKAADTTEDPTGAMSGAADKIACVSTPRWWFKSKSRPEVKTIAPGEPVQSAYTTPSTLEEPASPRPAAASAPPASMGPPLASSIDVPEFTPTAPAPRVQPPVAVSVDPDKQQISLRISYTSALIGGFSVFIALGLAVLIGKGLSRGPGPALANASTAVLRRNPPTPGVMNVQRRSETPQQQRVAQPPNDAVEGPGNAGGARPSSAVSTGTRATQQSFNEPRPPATFFTDDPHRINGLNYAIIQSFPSQEMGKQVAEFLTNNGIPCTVERDLPGWGTPASWKDGCTVVGIRGFDKVRNNPALETYKHSIMAVSTKFTNGRSGFKAFAPQMYQWKKGN